LATTALVAPEANYYLGLWLFTALCLSFPLSLLIYVAMRFKEMIEEVREKANRVVQLSEEKKEQAINQQKILQEEVNKQTIELRTSLENLKATQSQLIQSEKMASLGELTAGIAHEIQNPLNFVNNFSDVNSELIDEAKQEMDKGNTKEAKTILDDLKENELKINHHGKRADAIVKNMLQHSRASSGKKEPTDINALAEEYLRLSYHGLRAKDKSFNAITKTDFDTSIGKINIIPQDIGRVVLNLINNAFYAVDEKKRQNQNGYEPTVLVSTKKLNGKVEIIIKDNGNGIPQKVLDKIFQPFFTTKPTGQGTGLGLSLSYDIVKAHGGELKVETKESEGCEFKIVLSV
jgi:signal transduction histidine kinase